MEQQKKDRQKELQEKAVKQAGESGLDSESGIDKVRDILLGTRIKEQERQYSYFQSKIESEVKATRAELISRVEDLELFIKNEIREITSRIKADRESADRTSNRFEGMLAELRELLLNRTKVLNEEFRTMNTRFFEEVKREIDFLGERKLDRNQFSEFLSEWAVRLTHLPDEEKNGRRH